MVVKFTLPDAARRMQSVILHEKQKRVEVHFADGAAGYIPFKDLAVLAGKPVHVDWKKLQLVDEHEFRIPILSDTTKIVGRQEPFLDVPWDFARAYCDPQYAAQAKCDFLMDQAALAFNVSLLREARGMSQEELAARASVSRVTISKIENRQGAIPKFATLGKIAKVFDLPIADLFNTEQAQEDYVKLTVEKFVERRKKLLASR